MNPSKKWLIQSVTAAHNNVTRILIPHVNSTLFFALFFFLPNSTELNVIQSNLIPRGFHIRSVSILLEPK